MRRGAVAAGAAREQQDHDGRGGPQDGETQERLRSAIRSGRISYLHPAQARKQRGRLVIGQFKSIVTES